MNFFLKRKAKRLLWMYVSHPVYARQFTSADAESLLAEGAEPNSLMPELWSPLSHICVWGNVPVARVLLEHGADPDGNKYRDAVPLHIAAQNGHEELVELLADFGADMNARDSHGQTALHCALIVNSAQNSGVAELLVQLGTDPQITDSEGRTPLERLQHHARVYSSIGEFGNMTYAERYSQNRKLVSNLERFEALLGPSKGDGH